MSWLNILYKVRNGAQPNPNPSISARVHVNYWKLPVKKHFWNSKLYSRSLDIGVVLENVSDDIEEVAICLPFSVNTDNVRDLSECLHNETFVSHLLNGRYRCFTLTDCPTYRYLQLQDEQEEGKNLCLYEVCDESKEIVKLNKGCMLLIKILSYPKNLNEIKEKPSKESAEDNKYNLYFRIRISNLSENDLCFNEDISNDFIQSAFSKSEMAEIVFNDKRNINHSDFQTITRERSFITLSKIDFFFSGSSEEETVTGSSPFNDCELLDSDLWKAYLSGINTSSKKCLSYHWSVDESRKNKVFFKTVYSSHNRKKILKYALCVILLSFLASCLLELSKAGIKAFKQNYNNDSTTSIETVSDSLSYKQTNTFSSDENK